MGDADGAVAVGENVGDRVGKNVNVGACEGWDDGFLVVGFTVAGIGADVGDFVLDDIFS